MVNNVTLVGRITKDPEVRATGSGSVCSFSLAINRNFKNAQGEYDADFVNCVAFNATAQNIQQYVSKGNILAVSGRIQTRNYDNNQGQRVYVTEVIANTVSFIETSRNNNSANTNNTNMQNNQPQSTNSAPNPYNDINNTQNMNNNFNTTQVDQFTNIDDDDLPF
ncbi:MAG: single-stranded DNA-binding protein [Mycoplasmatales bacterium]